MRRIVNEIRAQGALTITLHSIRSAGDGKYLFSSALDQRRGLRIRERVKVFDRRCLRADTLI